MIWNAIKLGGRGFMQMTLFFYILNFVKWNLEKSYLKTEDWLDG